MNIVTRVPRTAPKSAFALEVKAQWVDSLKTDQKLISYYKEKNKKEAEKNIHSNQILNFVALFF